MADSSPGFQSDTLERWLTRLESLHPSEIELGLERVSAVADRLGLLEGFPCLITVAGTNGKGSCVAAMEALLLEQGHSVGTYTSPHLLRYNERIRIDGHEAEDAAICRAFEQIERARDGISLTYFEFGTLAALLLFRAAQPDVVVLETGLGGRLDAVNILDADVAVISSIGLDHQQWLGGDREAIGREKAGIFRRGHPVVCVEPDPPHSVMEAARVLGCPWYGPGGKLQWQRQDDAWSWQGEDAEGRPFALNGLPLPSLALSNVAAALQALALTPYRLDATVVARVLPGLQLAGRRQRLFDVRHQRHVMLDVAHNEQAAQALARALKRLEWPGRIHLVLAMMADKDHAAFYRALESGIDFWYITRVEQPRCLPAESLLGRLTELGATGVRGPYADVPAAYDDACRFSGADDLILVCGSFYTVSAMMQLAGTPFTPDPER